MGYGFLYCTVRVNHRDGIRASSRILGLMVSRWLFQHGLGLCASEHTSTAGPLEMAFFINSLGFRASGLGFRAQILNTLPTSRL